MMLSEINQKKKKKKAVTVSSHLYIKSKKKNSQNGISGWRGKGWADVGLAIQVCSYVGRMSRDLMYKHDDCI